MTIKSRKPIFSRASRADLRSLHRYIATDNPTAAVSFLRDINRKITWIAESSIPGGACTELSPDLRGVPYRDRWIYFRVKDNHILIVRILHGRRDISSEVFPESEI